VECDTALLGMGKMRFRTGHEPLMARVKEESGSGDDSSYDPADEQDTAIGQQGRRPREAGLGKRGQRLPRSRPSIEDFR
jgi:hypothetical protein